MPERIDGIALIQHQPDMLAAALADAIRGAGDLRIIEPAPADDALLDSLIEDRTSNPVILLVGPPAVLRARSRALSSVRPELIVVAVPIGEPQLELDAFGL